MCTYVCTYVHTHIYTHAPTTGVLRAALQYYRTNVPGMLRLIATAKLGALFSSSSSSSASGPSSDMLCVMYIYDMDTTFRPGRPVGRWVMMMRDANQNAPLSYTPHTGNTQSSPPPAPVLRAPTLGISGLRDGCMLPRIFDLTMGSGDGNGNGDGDGDAVRYDHPLFPGGVRVAKVEGAGHFVHQERPEEVNALLLGWFRRCEEEGKKGGE